MQSNYTNFTQPNQVLAQCERLIQQLTNQTQQASMQYEQLMRQEQENAMQLEQLAQREKQAAHIIQTALQGHQMAIQQLHQISNACNQLVNTSNTFATNMISQQQNNQTNDFLRTQH
ncbi:AMP-dependent synthetase and ligase [Paenibacillus sp. R14(2021)]|uniref:AMP-dependent synthetase and ligase n=1 Tax=Paenibacillus sp. R14(2021) TaxID=2859228 RepID=UPI001C6143A7|nr:AMP-dependent synthetase and ligase [Paenibacillus sp. R14(2021)]